MEYSLCYLPMQSVKTWSERTEKKVNKSINAVQLILWNSNNYSHPITNNKPSMEEFGSMYVDSEFWVKKALDDLSFPQNLFLQEVGLNDRLQV